VGTPITKGSLGVLVGDVLAALRIDSATSFSWFGRRAAVLPRGVGSRLDPDAARTYLCRAVTARLYRDFYCPGTPMPTVDASAPPRSFPPFLATLSAANTGTGSREDGWQVRQIGARQVIAAQRGLTVRLAREDIHAPADARPGTTATIRLPKELLRLSPGFYLALGDEGLPRPDQEPMLRLYWNLSAAVAADFVHAVTATLNPARVPFQLKVIDDPDRYDRCDAGVLYLPRCHYPAVETTLGTVYRRLRSGLGNRVPPFTKVLAPGLAVAEDPGDGGSFGRQRCGLLAEAVIRARERRVRSPAGRTAVVVECFVEAGLDPDAPHLNAGSPDSYHVLVDPGGQASR
jgi:hypothetical protein